MIKNLAEIETSLGLKEGEFKLLYEDKEEKEIPLTDYSIVKKADHEIFTKADYETRIENIKKVEKTAAVEIAVKDARTKLGLDFTGKTMDNLVEAYGKKVLAEAKIEPDKKVIALQQDMDKLRLNLTEKEQAVTALQAERENEKRQANVEGTIMRHLPKAKTKISVEDLAIIFKSKYRPSLNEDGKLVLHDDKGAELKNDKTLALKTIDEVMLEFQTNYIEGPAGGGGGGDGTGGGKPGTMEAFNTEMQKGGIAIMSAKYQEEMKARIKAGTLKV